MLYRRVGTCMVEAGLVDHRGSNVVPPPIAVLPLFLLQQSWCYPDDGSIRCFVLLPSLVEVIRDSADLRNPLRRMRVACDSRALRAKKLQPLKGENGIVDGMDRARVVKPVSCR